MSGEVRPEEPPDRSFEWTKSWYPYALIAGLAVLLYFQTLSYGLTQLDDNILIEEGQALLRSVSAIPEIFRHGAFYMYRGLESYYRPLLTVSFLANYQLSGTALPSYHAVNIALHAGASALVFPLLVRLGYGRLTALLATLLFCAHPALTQAVAWIPGRNDSLLGLFVFASFLSLLEHERRPRRAWLAAHLLLFAAALFTKETAIVLPILALAHLAWIERQRDVLRTRLPLVAGWVALALCWAIVRRSALGQQNDIPFDATVKLVIANLPAVPQLLGKALLPFNLAVMPTIADTRHAYGLAAALVVGAGIVFSKRQRRGAVLFGASWFLLFLLPTLSLPHDTLMLEQRLYVPLLGLAVVLLEIDLPGLVRWPATRELAIALLFLAVFLTKRHAAHFKDGLTFTEAAIAGAPRSGYAHSTRGVALNSAERRDEAFEEFKQAVSLKPDILFAHYNLGVYLFHHGRQDEARQELQAETRLNPLYDKAYFAGGMTYFVEGKLEEAEILFKRALELNPASLDALTMLVDVTSQRGDLAQNQAYFRELQRLSPIRMVDTPPPGFTPGPSGARPASVAPRR